MRYNSYCPLRLIVLICLFTCFGMHFLQGQAFLRTYPLNYQWSYGQTVSETPDGFHLTATRPAYSGASSLIFWRLATDTAGFLLTTPQQWPFSHETGSKDVFLEDNSLVSAAWSENTDAFILEKRDASNNVLWSTSTLSPDRFHETVGGLLQASDGSWLVCGSYNDSLDVPGNWSLFIWKFSPTGQLLWQQSKPVPAALPDGVNVNHFLLSPDDGVVIQYAYSIVIDPVSQDLAGFDANGNLLWNLELGTGQGYPYVAGMKMLADGSFWMDLYEGLFTGTQSIKRYDASGNLLAATDVQLGPNKHTETHLFFPQADGGLVVAGEAVTGQFSSTYREFYMAKFNSQGQQLWLRLFPMFSTDAYVAGGTQLADGSFAFTGRLGQHVLLFTTDAEGILFDRSISGKIGIDDDLDCLLQTGDIPFGQFPVQADNGTLQYYTVTDADGFYQFENLDTGSYQISFPNLTYFWEPCLMPPVLVTDTIPFSALVDIPLQGLPCPFMTVDISTSFLRRCFDNTYYVHYCNQGGVAVEDAAITITLPSGLDFVSASIPVVQNGQELSFYIGAVPILTCDDFSFIVNVNCDSTALGETKCVSAHITPDTLCSNNGLWSGATLRVEADCIGDSVARFRVKNVGYGPSAANLNYIVVDDHVISRNGQLPSLQPNDEIFEYQVSDTGTVRFVLDQQPEHPLGTMPSVAVEGCGTNNNALGFINQFPNETGSPFDDIDCHVIVASFDPNDKQAFPVGVDNEHFIEQNQSVDYMIRFQNTGTDTAFTVVLRDTLSPWLDPGSIRPGAASHPYTWELSGNNVLTMRFDQILLPDSNVNEAASHGFFKFNIKQQKDNPFGTIIENRAGIYFDFNPVVLTNTVFHTVEQHFLTLGLRHFPSALHGDLDLYPNPAADFVYVALPKNNALVLSNRAVCRLYNVYGDKMMEKRFSADGIRIDRNDMPAGVYMCEVWCDGVQIGRRKLVWH